MKNISPKYSVSTSSRSEKNTPQGFFQLSDDIFSRAEQYSLHVQTINCEPVRKITRATGQIFSALDRSDPAEAAAARQAWQLRSTVLFTVMPFNAKALALEYLSNRLSRAAQSLPAIQSFAAEIKENVIQLVAYQNNPKRALIERICGQHKPTDRIGVLAGLCPGEVPGWTAKFRTELAEALGSNIVLIESRRDLRYSTFKTLIIPAGLRHCAPQLAAEAIHGCRAFSCHLLRYETENPALPERRTVPEKMPFSFAKTAKTVYSEPVNTTETPPSIEAVDQWLEEGYWTRLRSSALDTNDANEVTERGRLIVFQNGKGAFLPEEGKVIEVSGLFDSATQSAGIDLPRKRVNLLEEGDLILIRTSGGGDYVELVADALLAQARKPHLRATALDWKPKLRAALHRTGVQRTVAALRKHGGRITYPAYIHNWAGDVVMSPQRSEDFFALIRAVAELNELNVPDTLRYAQIKWNEMEDLKGFHHRAGQKIRQELLVKVNELAASKVRIDSELRISLPHAEGGEMWVLRIGAIDQSVVEVPRSRLFRLEQARLV